jgi:hypothetical protein
MNARRSASYFGYSVIAQYLIFLASARPMKSSNFVTKRLVYSSPSYSHQFVINQHAKVLNITTVTAS